LRSDRQVRANFFFEVMFVELRGPSRLEPREYPHG
jgi:hypothetical protein